MRRYALAVLSLAAVGTARAQAAVLGSEGSLGGLGERIAAAEVPEPGSVAVFAFALVVMGLARVARLRNRA